MSNEHHENVVVNTNIGIRFWKSVTNASGYVPFHWHSSIEIVCVMKGRLTFHIAGQAYVVNPLEFIAVPSGIVHDVANVPNTAFVLQIPLTVIEPYIDHPENFVFYNGHKDNPAYQQIVKLIEKMGDNQRFQPRAYRFNNELLFIQILKLLFTRLATNQNALTPNSRIKDVIIYVNSHYQQPLTVSSLARRFGYNANYLSRLFKQQSGITLIKYIYEVRINHFYDDLLNSKISVKLLMRENGLSNEHTTRKIFKEMFGCLPNELRQKKSR